MEKLIFGLYHTLDLFLFYIAMGLLFWVFWSWTESFTWASIIKGIGVSGSIILIGSEYYEIPVFLLRYLQLFGYPFPYMVSIMNHLSVALVFLFFVWFTRLKRTKKNALMLSIGPVFTAPFLFWFPVLYLARMIGLSTLFIAARWGDKH